MRPYPYTLLIVTVFTCFFLTVLQPGYSREVIQLKNKTILIDTMPQGCTKNDEIEKIISDAISIGAPIYNAGMHMACYRIYEWAAYKILYEYGRSCTEVEKILKIGVEKSHGDFSDTEKAWIMRASFDKILGVPTITTDPEKKAAPQRNL
jgi:hypothetical protein